MSENPVHTRESLPVCTREVAHLLARTGYGAPALTHLLAELDDDPEGDQ